MNWDVEVLKKYAVFSGRARRKEYWMFSLINFLIYLVLMVIEGVSGLTRMGGIGPLTALYTLATVIPGLAVSIRRLHDTNRSGWWLFISLIPLIGGIILLVFMATDSDAGENQYGPNPKSYAAY